MIEHCRSLATATDLPVSADLENCFADDPAEATATILLAARAGVVGGDFGLEFKQVNLELAAQAFKSGQYAVISAFCLVQSALLGEWLPFISHS